MNLLHRLQGLALGLAVLLVAACGPNGGGTGTGESYLPLADFGATAASSCSAPFAAALACTQVSVTTVAADRLAGTDGVDFAAGAGRELVALHLQDNVAQLVAQCGRARFDGEWGVRSDGQGHYFGAWRVGADRDGTPALLRLRAVDGQTLELTVLDAAGRQLLFGVPGVARVGAAPPVPDC